MIRALLFAGIVAVLTPSLAPGQGLSEELEILGKVTYTPPDAMDYFMKDAVPSIRSAAMSVKMRHLGESSFWRHYRNGRKEEALSETIFVLRLFPNHPEALALLSIVCREMDDLSTPIPFYERAIRLFPSHAYTRAQYGYYLSTIGQQNAGRIFLEEALRMDPSLEVARGWLESLNRFKATPPAAAGTGTGRR